MLQRLSCTDLIDVVIEIESDTLPQNIADIVFQDIANLNQLNTFAKSFKGIGDKELKYISEVIDYTNIATIPELKTLIDCYQEFEMIENIHSPTEYGL